MKKELLIMILVSVVALAVIGVILSVTQDAYYGAQSALASESSDSTASETSTSTSTSTSTTVPVTSTTTVPTTSTSAPTEPEPEPEPTYPVLSGLNAKQAFVYDVQAGTYLYVRGYTAAPVYPASITKLFTAYVALQILDPSTEIQVGSEIHLIGTYSSVAELEVGDRLTVEQLVAAMLLPSGNDASYTLAAAAGRKLAGNPSLTAERAIAIFMSRVNQIGRVMGFRNTHFTKPDGYYSEDHYTCMDDLLKMALVAIEDPTISRLAQCSEYSFVTPDGKVFLWHNSNRLILEGSSYYHSQATGLKTGYLNAAGNCLLSSFNLDGRELIICVLGCETHNQRYEDTLMMLEYFS